MNSKENLLKIENEMLKREAAELRDKINALEKAYTVMVRYHLQAEYIVKVGIPYYQERRLMKIITLNAIKNLWDIEKEFNITDNGDVIPRKRLLLISSLQVLNLTN